MNVESQSEVAKVFVSQFVGAIKQPDKNKGRKTISKLLSMLDPVEGPNVGAVGTLIYEIKTLVEKSSRSRYGLASALCRAGRLEEAEFVLSPVPQFCSTNQLNLHASVAVGLGKNQEAEALWSRAIQADPEYLPAINGLLDLHKKAGNESMISAMTASLLAAQASARPSVTDLIALVVYKPWREFQRFGGPNDGGYLVMDQPGGYDCFLSGGVGKYVVFEEQFCTNFGIECHAFDPTVESLPSIHSGIRFKKKGIGNKNTESATNLAEYLTLYKDVFVKMDVEGSEYNWIESLSDEEIRNIKQLVIEWHNPNTKRRLACVARLAKTHVLVHIHPNNVRKNFNKLAGVDVPVTFETTFVRKENPPVTIIPNTTPLPHPLDAPNVAANAEVSLAWWPFVSISAEVGASAPKIVNEKEAPIAEPPRDVPKDLFARYTVKGTIPVQYRYFNQMKSVAVKLALAKYAEVLDKLEKGTFAYYGATLNWLLKAVADFPLEDKDVCVFGCVNVNCDAIALHSRAEKVTILEYNVPVSEHPKVACLKLADALKMGHQYDAAFSISSFEHDGLGRYGDPLDPDGDLRAMQEAHRILKPGGILFFAAPVGPDCLVWNAHRIYGPKRLPMLFQSWTVLKSYGFSEDLYSRPLGSYKQPVFVLRKDG